MLTAGFSYDSEIFSDNNRSAVLPLGDMYRYGVGFEKSADKDFKFGGGFRCEKPGDTKIGVAVKMTCL